MATIFKGKEHFLFFKQLTKAVNSAINRENHYWKSVNDSTSEKRIKELNEEIAPSLRGSALVTMIANVEHLVGKKADKKWDIPSTWYGNDEFKLLRIIRHCWAHAAGRVLPNRAKELNDYLNKYANKKIVDRDNVPLKPLFSIVNNKVILKGLRKVEILCCELLAEKGLVEKWYK